MQSITKVIFETKRFIVRQYHTHEMQGWIDMLTHPEIGRFLPKHTPDKWKAIFLDNLEAYEQSPALGRWAIVNKQTGQVAGNCMLANAREGLDGLELGYAFEQAYWGTGAGTEIVNGILNYAFGQLNMDLVCAITVPENIASIRVLEKSGFKNFGTIDIGTGELLLFQVKSSDL